MNFRNLLASTFFLRSILVISVFLLLFISSVSYKHTIALKESTELLFHSNSIQIKLEQLLSYIKDAETGQRGYIISKDTIFLQPYNNARLHIEKPISELKSLTSGDLKQYVNLDSLIKLIDRRLILLSVSLKMIEDPRTTIKTLDENLVRGKNVMDLLRKQTNKMIELEVSNFEDHEKKYAHEVYFTPLSTLFLILFSLLVFVLAFVKINKDLGILKKTNADLRITTEAFRHAEEIVKERNIELEQSNSELASFNHIASHDLQEPLRKIQTFISRIDEKEAGTFSDSTKEYFEKIQVSVKKMRSLINDLLTFSRITNSEKVFKKSDLNVLLDNARQELMTDIEEKKAIIHNTELPELNVIPFQIQQLFTNLLGNSLKYSRHGIPPLIKIGCEIVNCGDYPFLKNGGQMYYKISLNDNGIGFEQEYAGNLFDLFYRLNQTSELPGTGIGLSICKKIVDNHSGYITAEGKPGEGSTFTVFLPV